MAGARVVTLCCSVRFADQLLAAHLRLSLHGDVVLMPALPSGESLGAPDVELLARLHRAKVAMADAVHVVNPDGYVGPTTRSEIDYAVSLGKPVTYEWTAPDGP